MAAESDPSSLLKGVRGVVFDMDGSLTQPDAIDFQRLRRRLGIAADQGILEAIEAEVSQVRRGEMMDIVHEEEERGLEAMALMDGAAALLDALDAAGVKRGLITRNSERAMGRTLALLDRDFDIKLSRSFKPAKPHPAALLHIMKEWDMDAKDLIMVGDTMDDVAIGVAVKCRATVLIGETTHRHYIAAKDHADVTVQSLTQLQTLLLGDAAESDD